MSTSARDFSQVKENSETIRKVQMKKCSHKYRVIKNTGYIKYLRCIHCGKRDFVLDNSLSSKESIYLSTPDMDWVNGVKDSLNG